MSEALPYIDAHLHEVGEAWDGVGGFVAPGEYILQCDKVESGTSDSGNPKLTMTYQVIEALGELAEQNADQVGATVVQSVSLKLDNDTVARRFKNVVHALLSSGPDDGGFDENGGVDPNRFVGCQMSCEIITEEYDKADPNTGGRVSKTTTRVRAEQPLWALEDRPADAAPADAAPAQAPAAAGPATPAAPKAAPPARGRGRGRRNSQPTSN